MSVGQLVLARDRDRAPERSGDDDRRGGGGAIADAEDRLGDLAVVAHPAPVVDPGGRAGAQHAADRRALPGLEHLADAQDVDAVAVVAADDRRAAVAAVAEDRRRVDLQHPRALLRHGPEHALRADLGGDQRRDAPQRPLLGGQPRDLRRAWPPGSPGSARSSSSRERFAVGEVDAGGDERDRAAVGAGHRPVGPRDQAPAAGLGLPVADLRARRAGLPDVSRGSPRTPRAPPDGITKSRASLPSTSSREKPVARSQASLNSTIRASRSYTQTSDCVVSVRIAANDSPRMKSSMLAIGTDDIRCLRSFGVPR